MAKLEEDSPAHKSVSEWLTSVGYREDKPEGQLAGIYRDDVERLRSSLGAAVSGMVIQAYRAGQKASADPLPKSAPDLDNMPSIMAAIDRFSGQFSHYHGAYPPPPRLVLSRYAAQAAFHDLLRYSGNVQSFPSTTLRGGPRPVCTFNGVELWEI